jgi:GAF domain-containing protein
MQAQNSEGGSADSGLAQKLSEFAREMHADTDMTTMLQRIVDAAVHEVAGAAAVGITLAEHGRLSTPVQTDPLVSEIDGFQYAANEGPCLSALREEATVRADDLRADSRWPAFAALAVEHGVRSMLSFQLYVESDSLGALNMYAPEPNAFRDADESVGLLLASHAALAIASRRLESDLRVALDSRDVIGQAKGVLMERFKVSSEQAFQMLIAVSQHLHRKLRDVAEELATSGELPVSRR